jgi:DNA-binding response OmpR family regulator
MGVPNKLLIIDDNSTILDLLDRFFASKQYQVITTTDGLEGLKVLEEEDIDLVITDIVMPTISGAGIISIIKKKYPDMPVVAMTGWGKYPEELASEMEADLVVGKPLDFSTLEEQVGGLLSKNKNGKPPGYDNGHSA